MSKDEKTIDNEKIYYDENKKAWAKETIDEDGFKITCLFPADKEESYQSTYKKYSDYINEVFYKGYFEPRLLDFFHQTRLKPTQELGDLVYRFLKDTFSMRPEDKEFKAAKEKLIIDVNNILEEQQKKKDLTDK
ncbi:hypothetical protein [Bacillus sp. J37]|uniref:hypothetical protein n=1 Tax=Bacillus sp. J37 TaxID=935837 RepID=UPI0004786D5E|nr:hypothetical protein [Bacillus sp. J37]